MLGFDLVGLNSVIIQGLHPRGEGWVTGQTNCFTPMCAGFLSHHVWRAVTEFPQILKSHACECLDVKYVGMVKKKVLGGKKNGLVRDSNPGPLAPEARIIPLDQQASTAYDSRISLLNLLAETGLCDCANHVM